MLSLQAFASSVWVFHTERFGRIPSQLKSLRPNSTVSLKLWMRFWNPFFSEKFSNQRRVYVRCINIELNLFVSDSLSQVFSTVSSFVGLFFFGLVDVL